MREMIAEISSPCGQLSSSQIAPLDEQEDKELRTKNAEQHREWIDCRVGNRRRIALHEGVGKRECRRIGHAPCD